MRDKIHEEYFNLQIWFKQKINNGMTKERQNIPTKMFLEKIPAASILIQGLQVCSAQSWERLIAIKISALAMEKTTHRTRAKTVTFSLSSFFIVMP